VEGGKGSGGKKRGIFWNTGRGGKRAEGGGGGEGGGRGGGRVEWGGG